MCPNGPIGDFLLAEACSSVISHRQCVTAFLPSARLMRWSFAVMNSESQPAYPDCPECHGSGFKVLSGVFLDRIDEVTVPCPVCTARAAEERRELEKVAR